MSFLMEVSLRIFLVSRIQVFFLKFWSDRQFWCIGTMLEFAANHSVANVWWMENNHRFNLASRNQLCRPQTVACQTVKRSNGQTVTPQEPRPLLAVSLNPKKIRRSGRCVHPRAGAEHHRALCRVRSYLAQLAVGGLCSAVTTAPWSNRSVFFFSKFADYLHWMAIEWWDTVFSEPWDRNGYPIFRKTRLASVVKDCIITV